ncbi:hypothetical protein DV735_g3029, partial [Chaetothyriales sp. CBS 134920]
MGQGQSSGAAAAEDEGPQKADYYDLLGVDKNATDDEIKKAYRRKALELHPDRNYGNVEEATRLFAEVQTAYEVLSDAQERAWYDSHRHVLLRGDDAPGDGTEFSYNIRMTTATEVQKLMLKFNGKLEFSDGPTGFFGGLNEFFNQLAKEESIACQWDDQDPLDYPPFGSVDDDYSDIVRPFYAAWTGFATQKSYAWKDKYRLTDAPDRRIRRLMEKENRKLREEAIQEFNDSVRSLVAFVRKRDPRVQENQKSEAERQKILKDAAAAQAARARVEREAQFRDLDTSVPAWARSQEKDALEGGFSSESEIEAHEYECVVCDKSFRSEAQFHAHEKSKKHQKLLKQLKKDLRRDGIEEDLRRDGIEEDLRRDGIEEDLRRDGIEEDLRRDGIEEDLRRDGIEEDLRRDGIEEDHPVTVENHEGGEVQVEVEEDNTRAGTEANPANGTLAGEDTNEITAVRAKLVDLELDSAAATTDTDGPENQKIGKAKLKRAKKAAKEAMEAPVSKPEFSCVSCQAGFTSKSKLFDHLKKQPSHAAPVSQTKSAEHIHEYDKKLHAFDSFMRNFRARHPTHELEVGTQWSIRLLELALLLQQHRECSTGNHAAYNGAALCAESRQLELQERRDVLQRRRAWREARSCSPLSPEEKDGVDAEEAIFQTWEEYLAPAAGSQTAHRHYYSQPLFGVLHRFMDLSAEIAEVMGALKEKLMQLVCDLMLQTALQVLLKHKYPYAPVETGLLHCLEHFWTLNHDANLHGKPVLVQIEEGGLQGLGNEDFVTFLKRCGI